MAPARYYAAMRTPHKVWRTGWKGSWMILDRSEHDSSGGDLQIAVCATPEIAQAIANAMNERMAREG